MSEDSTRHDDGPETWQWHCPKCTHSETVPMGEIPGEQGVDYRIEKVEPKTTAVPVAISCPHCGSPVWELTEESRERAQKRIEFYRDIRSGDELKLVGENVCPECASPLDEATVTKRGMELPGYECDCGWSGVAKDTSYRQTSEESDDE